MAVREYHKLLKWSQKQCEIKFLFNHRLSQSWVHDIHNTQFLLPTKSITHWFHNANHSRVALHPRHGKLCHSLIDLYFFFSGNNYHDHSHCVYMKLLSFCLCLMLLERDPNICQRKKLLTVFFVRVFWIMLRPFTPLNHKCTR